MIHSYFDLLNDTLEFGTVWQREAIAKINEDLRKSPDSSHAWSTLVHLRDDSDKAAFNISPEGIAFNSKVNELISLASYDHYKIHEDTMKEDVTAVFNSVSVDRIRALAADRAKLSRFLASHSDLTDCILKADEKPQIIRTEGEKPLKIYVVEYEKGVGGLTWYERESMDYLPDNASEDNFFLLAEILHTAAIAPLADWLTLYADAQNMIENNHRLFEVIKAFTFYENREHPTSKLFFEEAHKRYKDLARVPRRSYRQYDVSLGENLLIPSTTDFSEALRSYNGKNTTAYMEILPDNIASMLISVLNDNAKNKRIIFSEGSYIQVKKQENGSITRETIANHPENKIVMSLSDYNERLLEKVYTYCAKQILKAYKMGVDISGIDPYAKMEIPAPILISNETTRTYGVKEEAVNRIEADLLKLNKLVGYTETKAGGHNTEKVLTYHGMEDNIYKISAPYIIKLIQLINAHSDIGEIETTHTSLLRLSYTSISDEVIAEIIRKLCIQVQQAGCKTNKAGKVVIPRTLKSLADEMPELAARIEGEISEELKARLKANPDLVNDHDFQEQVKRRKADSSKKFLQRFPENIKNSIDKHTALKERYKNLKVEITFGTGKEKTITHNNWQTVKIVITHSGTITADNQKRAEEIKRARDHARRKHDNKIADKELEAALKRKKDENKS